MEVEANDHSRLRSMASMGEGLVLKPAEVFFSLYDKRKGEVRASVEKIDAEGYCLRCALIVKGVDGWA